MTTEKSAMYYDKLYSQSKEYALHPEKSLYFPVWQIILEHLDQKERIVELGCGPGQLAKLLIDKGHKYMLGVDFSMRAITMAKQMNPQANFICENAFHFLEITPPFDTVIITEVLEHVTYDTELLAKIPKGKKIIFSVPNFDDPAHLRLFKNPQEVLDRYGKFLVDPSIQVHSRKKQQWYIVTAIKS